MDSVITRDPGVLGGLPVFRGTRVPVKNLFDCLEKGYAVREFLEDFPAVSKEQVKLLLKEVGSLLRVSPCRHRGERCCCPCLRSRACRGRTGI